MLGGLGEGVALQVMQLDGPALVGRQLGQRVGQRQELFPADRLVARRGAVGRQPGGNPARGIVHGDMQGSLEFNVASPSAVLADDFGELVGEDRPQPG